MKERLRKAYNEKRFGLPQSDPSVSLFVNEEEDDVFGDHVMSEDDTKDRPLSKFPDSKELNKDQNTINQSVVVGSALKRGPDGEFIIITKKKKKRKIKKRQVNFLNFCILYVTKLIILV